MLKYKCATRSAYNVRLPKTAVWGVHAMMKEMKKMKTAGTMDIEVETTNRDLNK
jgi:hypothetical protein